MAITAKPTHDGTYTVYEDGRPLASGLTRTQAEAYVAERQRQRERVCAD